MTDIPFPDTLDIPVPYHTHNGIDSPLLTFGAFTPAGVGVPAGSLLEIQYNFGGVFGSSPNFTYDPTIGGTGFYATTSNGRPIYIGIGTVSGSGSVSDFTIQGGAADTNTGGLVRMAAGNSDSGVGGDIQITGGQSNAGNSGTVYIATTSAVGTNKTAGDIRFSLGNKTGSGTSGKLRIFPIGADPTAGGSGISGILNFDSIASSDKTFTFPNTSGTIALTSDIVAPTFTETLGANLTTNGTFTGNATGWTLTGAVAYASNAVDFTAGAATIEQAIAGIANNNLYVISFVISNHSAGNLVADLGGNFEVVGDSDGTFTGIIGSDGISNLELASENDAFVGTIDTVTLKLITVSGLKVTDGLSNVVQLVTGYADATADPVLILPQDTGQLALVSDISNVISTYIEYGTFAPTVSASTNTDSAVTTTDVQYMKVGNVVTVSGRFTADPTSAATATSFEMDLPVASNIGNAYELSGVAFCGNIVSMGAEIIGVAANNTAKVFWKSSDVTSQVWSFTYTYQII